MQRLFAMLIMVFVLAACGAAESTAVPTNAPRPTSVPNQAVQPTAATSNQARATSAPAGSNAQPTSKQYDKEPELTIDPNKQYTATIKTEKGDIVIELFAKNAPRTVNSFIFLAKEGFYDNVTFHRVLPGFVAQGGDPTGTGRGGPGYEFINEYNDPSSQIAFDHAGVLAMANAGPNTNGSQFFITLGPTPNLTPDAYTVFGQVIEGQDVVDLLTPRDPQENPNAPAGDKILTITITEGE